MKKLMGGLGSFVVASLFGWAGSGIGFMTGIMFGFVGSGVGLYLGRKLAERMEE